MVTAWILTIPVTALISSLAFPVVNALIS
jgi:hypothetical protein